MAFAGDSLKQIKLLLRSLSTTTTSTSNGNRNSNENLFSSNELTSSSSSSSASLSPTSSDAESSTAADSDEYTNSDYPGILDVDLTSFTAEQRTVFIATVSILLVLSLCGNVGTLFVNVRRKIRPFFRACLISLAISDLLSTLFLTSAYVSQFTAEYVQIWRLGAFMCGFVPFITTAAILASSMILVGIALDRYFAVMKAVIGFWNPGVTFCCICMTSIWAASIGIACPVFCIYELFSVYILTEVYDDGGDVAIGGDSSTTNAVPTIATKKPPNLLSPSVLTSTITTTTTKSPPTSWVQVASNDNLTYTLVSERELVAMCVSNQRNVGLYYIIVFSIIFIPCIIGFIWLNSIIAKKLWLRRHAEQSKLQKKSTKPFKPKWKSKSKSKSTTNSFELLNANTPITKKSCECKFGDHSMPMKMPESNVPTVEAVCTTAHTTVTLPLPLPTTTSAIPPKPNTNGNTSRETRHIRMFTIVILLMAVFLLFRLPAWIFLVMRMYGSYSKKVHWIIYFSFGILNLTSCVLNPLFYTFLAQTIAYITLVKVTIWDNYCGVRLCYEHHKRQTSRIPTEAPTFIGKNAAPPEPEPNWSCGCCCSACGLPKPSFFYAGPPKKRAGSAQEEEMPEVIIKQPAYMLKDDKDEGVECSDASDDGDSMNGFYSERVYTIFPVALVSSSMGTD